MEHVHPEGVLQGELHDVDEFGDEGLLGFRVLLELEQLGPETVNSNLTHEKGDIFDGGFLLGFSELQQGFETLDCILQILPGIADFSHHLFLKASAIGQLVD